MNTAQTVLTQGARTQQLAAAATNLVPWIIGGILVLVAIILLTRK
jgi:hypothetical protein